MSTEASEDENNLPYICQRISGFQAPSILAESLGRGQCRVDREMALGEVLCTHLELPLPLLAHVCDLEHGGGEDGDDEGRREHLVEQ